MWLEKPSFVLIEKEGSLVIYLGLCLIQSHSIRFKQSRAADLNQFVVFPFYKEDF